MRLTSRRAEVGASAVEYALLVAAVAVVLIAVAAGLTRVLSGVLTQNCQQTAQQNATSPAGC